jgi:hypothetical protein
MIVCLDPRPLRHAALSVRAAWRTVELNRIGSK